MEEDLYCNGKIRISYLHSPEPGRENEVISGEDHELWFGEYRYIVQRGILRELANASEGNLFELIRLLDVVSPSLFSSMQSEDVGIFEIGSVFRNAYQREEELRDEWVRKHKAN